MAVKKKRTDKEELDFKRGFIALVFILEVILVFAFFDYLVHTVITAYAAPASYFISEIVCGTIVGFIAYLFVKKRPVAKKSAVIAGIISIALFVRFYLAGYAPQFLLFFLVVHFIILYMVTYVGCKVTNM